MLSQTASSRNSWMRVLNKLMADDDDEPLRELNKLMAMHRDYATGLLSPACGGQQNRYWCGIPQCVLQRDVKGGRVEKGGTQAGNQKAPQCRFQHARG
jgi:hypothetical protein